MTSVNTPAPALLLTGARRIGHPEPVDVLLGGGRVVGVGADLVATAADLLAAAGLAAPNAPLERIDLAGRVVIPGLWDKHVHMTQWAMTRRRLDVSAATSAAEAVAMVAERLRTAPPAPGTPLVGFGYRGELWADLPTAAALDAVAGETPVILICMDVHSAWFNSAALRYVGAEWVASGVLKEMDWFSRSATIDAASVAEKDLWVRDAAEAAAALGVVGIVDYEFDENLAPWRRRFSDGFDLLRVRAGVWPEHLDVPIAAGLATGDVVSREPSGLLAQGPLKIITDGSLNTRTAYCHEPYPGSTGPAASGVVNVPPAELTALLTRATEHGITAALHAIGDAAIAMVLDVFAATGARGSIEHVQLLGAGDAERMAALGIAASVQPEHAMDDRDVADRLWAGRTDRVIPLATLRAAGVELLLGSDAPVSRLQPWEQIASAVTRSRDGREPWHAEQTIDLVTAVASSVDGRPLGLAAGMPADLAVLDADPEQVVAGGDAVTVTAGLRGMPVAATLLAGRFTHRVGV